MSTLRITHGSQTASINQLGGGLMRYQVGGQDVLYGYETEEQKSGSMGDVLFPFPGRLEHSEYEFEGEHFVVSGARVKDGHAIHGFVKKVEWEVVKQQADSLTLNYGVTSTEYAEKGFPFDLTIAIEYRLSEAGLEIITQIKNTGSRPAPWGLGFHPYFTVGTEVINVASLRLPATHQVEFDPGLKPTGKLLPMRRFQESELIGEEVIDACFTDLQFENGRAVTRLSNAQRTVEVWQDTQFPYLQVYSADTIGEQHARRGLALEPQTCTGFAFNVPEMGLQVLQPREEWRGSWGCSLSDQ